MRKIAALLLASASLGQAAAQAPVPMRLCLAVTPYGHVQGFANFMYRGEVSGSDPQPHYGYWVVAIEGGSEHGGGAAWAQNGGGIRGDGGRVRFGVHNGSQYPLSFVVRRIATAEDFAELRRTARLGDALTDEQLARFPEASPLNPCQFEVVGDPVEGTPTVRGGACACP